MPKCYIHQPAGIGDIFFLQKMVRHYQQQEYDVVMLVYPHLMWLQDYLPDVIFEPNHSVTPVADDLYIDTHTADLTHNDGRIMSSKYSMAGLNCLDWADYFHFNRNLEKEQELFDLYSLSDDSRYIVTSTLCGTPPDYLVDFEAVPISNPDNLPIVNMRIIEGYSLFDWCKILENAERIYMINTSTNYILEMLNLKAKEYIIYAKSPGNLYQIDYLFKKGEIRCL